MTLFDWDDANRRHVARHEVSVREAEEAWSGPTVDLDSYPVDDEMRYEELGMTANGRILKLVSTLRGERVRIVTAHDVPINTQKLYLQAMVRR